ncbi:MAG: diaminopimelate epimerase [Bacteroidetes bacterium]|nr:diaminopimelate epimerase [Bacteroidota bacterium]
MKIAFEKYHGTGNDFILVDIRDHAFSIQPEQIVQLCNRHFGIGADGLILLDKAERYDFMMRYFNSDGHESSMCGNGGRCITAFARRLGIIDNKARFLAPDGAHHAIILSEESNNYYISLAMHDVALAEWKADTIFLDTGSPHFVKISSGLDRMNVELEGNKLRHDPQFGAGGTNVNFIEEKDGLLHIRTFERGVEEETLSCGTGVTAAALGWALKNKKKGSIEVNARGGRLSVKFLQHKDGFTDIRLEGPATFVFAGETDI